MSTTFEIRRQVALPATPEQVWRAVATREGQAAWSPDPGAEERDGMTVEREDLKRLYVRTPTEPDGSFHEFDYLLIPGEDGETVLEFTHRGDLGSEWSADFDYAELTGYGWDMYLHTLAQYLEHFPGSPAVYVGAQAPASASTREAWSVLERALGVTGVPELGERVRLTPDGLPPIEGVVDWKIPDDFLAVRADDGLYRFHSLAVMEMPIAIGHYIYAEGADQDALTRDWQAWLDRVYTDFAG